MLVKNNYNECLTNLACSIRKYFELDYKHNTLDYIDKLLEKKKPENVIVILFDGMGSKILENVLSADSFFIKNKLKDITTVFPATTTAATTSIRTGLNPVEHGWLGWNMYIAPINKTITLFKESEKGKDIISEEFLQVKDKIVHNTIIKEINSSGIYSSKEIAPFNENKYIDLDDMLNKIETEAKKPGKKYIYVYDDEPDQTMHRKGAYSSDVLKLITERNNKVEQMCNKLDNSIIFVIADHGHIKCENIYLKDYPEIFEMLERTTSIEQRAVSFKIKKGLKNDFVEKFNKTFGNYFSLYDKKDIIESKLFGDGTPNELFDDAIGDFIAIAEKSNKCLLTDGDNPQVSQHAGYTDDEIYVPLIVIDKT